MSKNLMIHNALVEIKRINFGDSSKDVYLEELKCEQIKHEQIRNAILVELTHIGFEIQLDLF